MKLKKPRYMKTRKEPLNQIDFYVERFPTRKEKGDKLFLVVASYEVLNMVQMNRLIAEHKDLQYRVTIRRWSVSCAQDVMADALRNL